jgi:hypothetical protein
VLAWLRVMHGWGKKRANVFLQQQKHPNSNGNFELKTFSTKELQYPSKIDGNLINYLFLQL